MFFGCVLSSFDVGWTVMTLFLGYVYLVGIGGGRLVVGWWLFSVLFSGFFCFFL